MAELSIAMTFYSLEIHFCCEVSHLMRE